MRAHDRQSDARCETMAQVMVSVARPETDAETEREVREWVVGLIEEEGAGVGGET